MYDFSKNTEQMKRNKDELSETKKAESNKSVKVKKKNSNSNSAVSSTSERFVIVSDEKKILIIVNLSISVVILDKPPKHN